MFEYISGETNTNPFFQEAYTFMEWIVEVLPELDHSWQLGQNS